MIRKSEYSDDILYFNFNYIQLTVASGSVDVIGSSMTDTSSNAASCSFHHNSANYISRMQISKYSWTDHEYRPRWPISQSSFLFFFIFGRKGMGC